MDRALNRDELAILVHYAAKEANTSRGRCPWDPPADAVGMANCLAGGYLEDGRLTAAGWAKLCAVADAAGPDTEPHAWTWCDETLGRFNPWRRAQAAAAWLEASREAVGAILADLDLIHTWEAKRSAFWVRLGGQGFAVSLNPFTIRGGGPLLGSAAGTYQRADELRGALEVLVASLGSTCSSCGGIVAQLKVDRCNYCNAHRFTPRGVPLGPEAVALEDKVAAVLGEEGIGYSVDTPPDLDGLEVHPVDASRAPRVLELLAAAAPAGRFVVAYAPGSFVAVMARPVSVAAAFERLGVMMRGWSGGAR